MVSRYISKLEPEKMVMEYESGPCWAMSLPGDLMPFYHVSAGVYRCRVGWVSESPRMHKDSWEGVIP